MTKTIWFDMDGTIANLYGVENWLADLIAHNPRPYAEAKVMWNMSYLARLLNLVQSKGYKIGIISWLSKNSNNEYDNVVTQVKNQWLKKHLKSVVFDEIHIVAYGTPKSIFSNQNDILFDDEIGNRMEWAGMAYSEKEIFTVLREIISTH